MNASLLDRRIYSMADVDCYLGLLPGTARRWIDGYRRAGRDYAPVIRERSTGDDIVTWGEFVETRHLSNYRDRGLSLQRLRPTVMRLREEFETNYPLAVSAPFTEVQGRELVLRAQQAVATDDRLALVVVRSGQLMLADPTKAFTQQAQYEEGSVRTLTPDQRTPDVRIDPLRQAGRPVVRSVPTDVLGEAFRAGENLSDLAELYQLSNGQVEQAIRFELRAASDAA